MIVGEHMSEVVDLSMVREDWRTGDMFQDPIHKFINRPLALGPFIYAKLAQHGKGYEVYWNHFNREITVTTPGGIVVQTNEEAFPIPRFDRIRYVGMFVEAVLEHEAG